MDERFLDDLDAHISNIGMDKIWKRRVGDKLVWFSPVTQTAQTKINEVMGSSDLGPSVITHMKLLTLSYAIVGFDDKYDLTNHRDKPVFRIPNERKPGKTVKVTLDKFLRHKMAGWGGDWIDSAFEVFADLMESHGKDLKKDVVFENTKDPLDELAELEMRASELRSKLKLPQMTESMEEPEEVSEEGEGVSGGEGAFDPFQKLPDIEEEEEEPSEETNSPTVGPTVGGAVTVRDKPVVQGPEAAPPATSGNVVRSIPIADPSKMTPIQKAVAGRRQGNVMHRAQAIEAAESSLDNPFIGNPLAVDDIVDKPLPKAAPLTKNMINKGVVGQSRNPRFGKPTR